MKDAKERGILKPYVSPQHNLVCLLPSDADAVASLSGRYPPGGLLLAHLGAGRCLRAAPWQCTAESP